MTERRAHATSRRPITDDEAPYLAALGRELRAVRNRLGISRGALADAAELSLRHIESLEVGDRRTRRSTLTRIATGIQLIADPDDADSIDVDELVERWVTVAGPALAPESVYPDHPSRRRRRAKRREGGLPKDIPGALWLIDLRARNLADRREQMRARGDWRAS